MEKSAIVKDLNALFKERAEFYAFFDGVLPKFERSDVYDFAGFEERIKEALGGAFDSGISGAGQSENKRDEFAARVSGYNKDGIAARVSARTKELYAHFYKYDYALRRLLPAIYKAYEIRDEDLNRGF